MFFQKIIVFTSKPIQVDDIYFFSPCLPLIELPYSLYVRDLFLLFLQQDIIMK